MITERNNPDHQQPQLQKIVVLGGGTSGLLAGLALKKHLPEYEVLVVRSTRLGVVGVGEGTIPSVVHFLHRFLGIDPFDVYSRVQASPKLGIRYLWGQRPFFHYSFSGQLITRHPALQMPRGYYCEKDFEFADLDTALMTQNKVCIRLADGTPRLNPNIAYHLENKKLVKYLESLADECELERIDAVVEKVQPGPQGVAALQLEDGRTIEGDLFIDCSGFAAELIGKQLDEEFIDFSNALFCDRAVVGGWQRTHETYHPFTTAETMNAGWCWRIEHDELINRGYVFCSGFLSDEEAVEEFQHSNPLAEVGKVIGFRAGVRRRSWVGNVIAVGNAAGFVEPLEATAIGMICDATVRLVRCLQASGGRILNEQQQIFNRITLDNWLIIRDFLALHYKYNTRLETPFWQAARADVDVGAAGQFVDYYRSVGPDFSVLEWEMKRDFFTAEGYLVMLLGQQVPFDRPVDISPDEMEAWIQLKTKLSAMAAGGLNVPEFLQLARGPDAANRFAQRSAGMTRIGEGFRMGELNWH